MNFHVGISAAYYTWDQKYVILVHTYIVFTFQIYNIFSYWTEEKMPRLCTMTLRKMPSHEKIS